MRHSSPVLLFGFIPITSILIIASGFLLGIVAAIFYYLFCGLLIWVIVNGETNFYKTLVFWWFAVVFDRPKWVDKSE